MNKNIKKILLLLVVVFLVTGCAQQLKGEDKKAVNNPETGQNLIGNILCKPTDEKNTQLYKDNGVDIDKLPNCEDFNTFSGGYEGLWTNFIVKPLSHLVIFINNLVKNAGLAIILVSVLLRSILFPVSLKTAEQSENMKKARPDIEKIEKKYKNRTDTESLLKKSQETSLVYKKHNISQASGCIMAVIQIPLLFGMIESIQRIPILYEGSFLSMKLGTTFLKGMSANNFYVYVIMLLIIAATTYFSFKFTSKDNAAMSSEMPAMPNMAPMMTIMIIISALFFPTATGLYWITSNLFTIGQNLFVERKKKNAK